MPCRDENYHLYAASLEQLQAMQDAMEQVGRQRDELRDMHREAARKV